MEPEKKSKAAKTPGRLPMSGRLVHCPLNERQKKVVMGGRILQPCPFCGNERAILATEQNSKTKIFVATILCGDNPFRCGVTMFASGFNRDRAEVIAIARWNKRTRPWRNCKDELPTIGQKVEAKYEGVYESRIVTYWADGANVHFGLMNEVDGKGSQPATHWRPLP